MNEYDYLENIYARKTWYKSHFFIFKKKKEKILKNIFLNGYDLPILSLLEFSSILFYHC